MKFKLSNLHTLWDESFDGKTLVLASSVGYIETSVNEGSYKLSTVHKGDDDYPFKDDEGHFYKYAYYDKEMSLENDEVKLAVDMLNGMTADERRAVLLEVLGKMESWDISILVDAMRENEDTMDKFSNAGILDSESPCELEDFVKNSPDLWESLVDDFEFDVDKKRDLIKEWLDELL